jgi:hypothetical protein
MLNIITEKRCSKCRAVKPATIEFWQRDTRMPHLCRVRCRECIGSKRRVRVPFEERFWSKVDKSGDCWLWTAGLSDTGYGEINRGGEYGMVAAHRTAWDLSVGPIPDGAWILHKCDVKRCCNPDHLFLGDAKSNVTDMIQKGRRPFRSAPGERHGSAKLTETSVREIRSRHANGESVYSMLGQYPVVDLYAVVSRRTWKHVQ